MADFSYPLFLTHMVLAIKNPLDAFNYSAYTDPLKPFAWIAVGLFCIVLPAFLTATTKYQILLSKSKTKFTSNMLYLLELDQRMEKAINSLGESQLRGPLKL